MARTASTLVPVLTRIVARLIDQISDATDSNCYIALHPDTLPAASSGEVVYVVSPAVDARFDDGEIDGGGTELVTIYWPIVVTIHNTAINDEVGHDAQFLTHSTRGTTSKATDVLKALVAHDVQTSSENEVLAHPLIPSDSAVNRLKSRVRGAIQLGFLAKILWNVSGRGYNAGYNAGYG